MAILVGFILWIHMGRCGDAAKQKKMTRVMLAGLVIILFGQIIETPREKVIANTIKLVTLTKPNTVQQIESLLHPQVVLLGPNQTIWLQGKLLLDEFTPAVSKWQVRKQGCSDISVAFQDAQHASVLVHIRTVLGSAEDHRPIHTDWEFDWEKQPEGQWLAKQIVWRKLFNQPPTYGLWK